MQKEPEMELLEHYNSICVRVPVEKFNNFLKKIVMPPMEKWVILNHNNHVVTDSFSRIDTVSVYYGFTIYDDRSIHSFNIGYLLTKFFFCQGTLPGGVSLKAKLKDLKIIAAYGHFRNDRTLKALDVTVHAYEKRLAESTPNTSEEPLCQK